MEVSQTVRSNDNPAFTAFESHDCCDRIRLTLTSNSGLGALGFGPEFNGVYEKTSGISTSFLGVEHPVYFDPVRKKNIIFV